MEPLPFCLVFLDMENASSRGVQGLDLVKDRLYFSCEVWFCPCTLPDNSPTEGDPVVSKTKEKKKLVPEAKPG